MDTEHSWAKSRLLSGHAFVGTRRVVQHPLPDMRLRCSVLCLFAVPLRVRSILARIARRLCVRLLAIRSITYAGSPVSVIHLSGSSCELSSVAAAQRENQPMRFCDFCGRHSALSLSEFDRDLCRCDGLWRSDDSNLLSHL